MCFGRSVGSGVRLQRAAVLDQAADDVQDVHDLAEASRSLAKKWREDELVEQEAVDSPEETSTPLTRLQSTCSQCT
jgi:hypothetical protein